MLTSNARRLIRKLSVLVVLMSCLTVLANSPGAAASKQKPTNRICCSLCNGEPTDPGACHYGCNENC
jgi:hypothetical protein